MLNEKNQIQNFILCLLRIYVIPFYYGSGSRTVINYGSGSAKFRNYGSYGSGSATLTTR
jgi:hypothetical protein